MYGKFKHLDLTKIQAIGECFTCIQGEGQNAGVPHFLIRLMGCNLNCAFSNSICDTAYASWAPEKGTYSLQDVINLIEKNPQINFAFVSGGEPTIHGKLLKDILFILKAYSISTAIETNGSTYVPELEDLLDLVTISPKMKNSVPVPGMWAKSEWVDRIMTQEDANKQEKNRANYDQMKQWVNNFDYQLKFVISSPAEMDEVKQIQQILNVPNHMVYLMPEGDLNNKIHVRRQMVIELCIKDGYNYTDRLHILAYGSKRGV